MTEKKSTLAPEIITFMDECLKKEHPESYLIAVLHKVQGIHGFLSTEHMDDVAHYLSIPTSTISGVATFYHFFRLQPRGKYAISVCLGTACFVKGADALLEAVMEELGIEVGETTTDGLFSIEESRCLGVCALAPVVTVNGKVYSNVTVKQIPQLLHKCRDQEEAGAA